MNNNKNDLTQYSLKILSELLVQDKQQVENVRKILSNHYLTPNSLNTFSETEKFQNLSRDFQIQKELEEQRFHENLKKLAPILNLDSQSFTANALANQHFKRNRRH